MNSFIEFIKDGSDKFDFLKSKESSNLFGNNSESITDILRSSEFKYWFKMGLSTFGLVVSFYATYKLLKLYDMTSESKKSAKLQGEKMLKKLGIEIPTILNERELYIASNLVDCECLNTVWSDIGGLSAIIEEIHKTVLSPLLNIDSTIHSSLYKPPKGMLIYGPPGCGKTMLVKALAKHSNARFLNLQASSIMDMYVGESEKQIEAIFTLAYKIQPVIIFIDEIDGLLSSRSNSSNQETFLSIKTTFMSLWDGILTTDSSKILVIGATNRPNSVDKAILRRLQIQIEIKLPNFNQRKDIFKVILQTESLDNSVDDITYDNLSTMSEGFPGSSIKDICRDAVTMAIYEFRINNSSSKKFVLKDSDLYTSMQKYIERLENIQQY